MYMGFLAKKVLKKLVSYMWAGVFTRSVKYETNGRTFCPVVSLSMSSTLMPIFEGFVINSY